MIIVRRCLLMWFLFVVLVSGKGFAVGINDPEEGGLGGTGHGSEIRPEGIERPDLPERVEPIERPDLDGFDIFESDSIREDAAPLEMPAEDAGDMSGGQ